MKCYWNETHHSAVVSKARLRSRSLWIRLDGRRWWWTWLSAVASAINNEEEVCRCWKMGKWVEGLPKWDRTPLLCSEYGAVLRHFVLLIDWFRSRILVQRDLSMGRNAVPHYNARRRQTLPTNPPHNFSNSSSNVGASMPKSKPSNWIGPKSAIASSSAASQQA